MNKWDIKIKTNKIKERSTKLKKVKRSTQQEDWFIEHFNEYPEDLFCILIIVTGNLNVIVNETEKILDGNIFVSTCRI